MHADDRAPLSGAEWGKPLVRLDEAWQGIESRLCAAVLVAEVLALSLWVFLRGMATDYFPGQNAAGLLTRSMLSTALFGTVAHLATRRRGLKVHRAGVTTGMVLGALAAGLWAHAGVAWASNLLNWLQNASLFMLIGGLRGLATRLTFWVAFLGASLASSRGKHIHVDVLLRYVPAKLKFPAASRLARRRGGLPRRRLRLRRLHRHRGLPGELEPACAEDASRSATAPCATSSPPSREAMSDDFFLLGRQLSLDVRSLPRVLAGLPYDRWMTAGHGTRGSMAPTGRCHFDKPRSTRSAWTRRSRGRTPAPR